MQTRKLNIPGTLLVFPGKERRGIGSKSRNLKPGAEEQGKRE